MKKAREQLDFSKALLKTAINCIENCYFHVGNVTVKGTLGNPMGIDPGPFWANFIIQVLYSFEEEYMLSLISSYKMKSKHLHPKRVLH